uniref:Uncharacterized protein n=1 Tax=Acrobeloides nanus TaxID=290746 RepID=A0A914EFL2_9BILA
MFTPVFEQAIKVAEIPLDDFVEWSKEIEDKKKAPNTVLFTNTARCASTLFGSMLQHEGKSVVFAEAPVLAQLSGGQSEGLWSDEELEKLVPASIRAIRKNIPSNQICVIKTTSSEVKLVPYTKLMRNVKHIFMFRRNAVDSVEKSTYRSLGKYAHKLVTVYLTLYKFSPSWYNWTFGILSFSDGWLFRKLNPINIKEWSFIVWIAPYLSYRKFEDQFCYPIVWHHDLIKNTEVVLKGVFKAISEPGHGELTEDCIPKALGRLKVDSQSGTFLSQEALKSVPLTPYTDETKKRLKKYKRDVEDFSRPENFVTIHEFYESSDILKDEHWFLYVLDKDYAYFVLLPNEIAHYNIINYPFMFTPVFEQAIKVAEMPLDDFIEWSKEIEDKKKTPNTVLFTNTARCASTLFGSMLQHEGKSVVFAEPHVLAQLSAGQSERVWNDEELEKLVPASIRAIRKNVPYNQICVIKTLSSDIKLVPYTKLMRNVKHIFMFRRNAVDSVEKSTYR